MSHIEKRNLSLIILLTALGCTNPLGDQPGAGDGFHPGLSGAPSISAVSPSAGASVGGTFLTITGANFVPGASVLIGENTCLTIVFVSSTQITCTTPAHTTGHVSVRVNNPDEQVATLASAFEYSSSRPGGPGFATLAGGGVSSGSQFLLQGSAGEKGTPFHQTGSVVRKQSGLRGVLQGP